ncbi:MAG: SigE family RNA polymerase sigma factor [Kibdelosporangium sp.]
MTFEEFAEAQSPALLRYATVLTCDPHLAEDILQEVLVRVHRKWQRIGEMESPTPYVRRMVTNQFLSWRRRKSAADVLRPPQDMVELGPHAGDAAGHYDERDALLAAVALLPKRQRAALVLRYFCDLTDEQTADAMGCRTASVRSYISRALAALRVAPAVSPSLGKPSLRGELG